VNRLYTVMGVAKLLPEVQLLGKEGKSTNRKNTEINILIWVQYFGIHMSVLGHCFPVCIPELMAYIQKIVKASQSYRGRTWHPTMRRHSASRPQCQITVNSELYTLPVILGEFKWGYGVTCACLSHTRL